MTHPLRLQQLVKLVDLTRLNDQDNEVAVEQWLEQQLSTPAAVPPAAICVYPAYLPLVQHWLQQRGIHCRLATVVNFPAGNQPIEQVEREIATALAAGADEIDCVLPYQQLVKGQLDEVRTFLGRVRTACGQQLLKVIIESGELATAQQVCKATELVIDCGADFVKSSTGKVPVGVTEDAARIMLTAIAAADRSVGFKASGGVRSIEFAERLLGLYEELTGQLATAQTMRIGASGLLQDIQQALDY
ncbi:MULTISPECIES: deoxyribose-phosphate aldolase [Rheinheimera]|uniref:Deoxyribose-phosphate aldolase n=1 Tax=Rheinheimera marina TaxID=1774958 RepID=A0ABV9JR37_9GAMM